MEAAEILDEGSASRLDVGSWQPVIGVINTDDLLPHVRGGMRGRAIAVTSTNVKEMPGFIVISAFAFASSTHLTYYISLVQFISSSRLGPCWRQEGTK